jgi:hypothetical protein
MALADRLVTGGGHHRSQRKHALRMLDRRRLADQSAEQGTDHMGGADLERVERPDYSTLQASRASRVGAPAVSYSVIAERAACS